MVVLKLGFAELKVVKSESKNACFLFWIKSLFETFRILSVPFIPDSLVTIVKITTT